MTEELADSNAARPSWKIDQKLADRGIGINLPSADQHCYGGPGDLLGQACPIEQVIAGNSATVRPRARNELKHDAFRSEGGQ